MLREELQLLQEQGSLVGEVVKAMDKKKVLVKVKYLLSDWRIENSHTLEIVDYLNDNREN